MQKIKQKDLIQVRKFRNMFQFIDNQTAINVGGQFEKVYHEIYPTELELKYENSSDNKVPQFS